MNKIDFENKLKDLSKKQEQTLANLNAIIGAMQLCKEFLKEEEGIALRAENEGVENVIEDSDN